jgi:quinol monooxygenase YgiN
LFAVTVTFQIMPGQMSRFRPLMGDNARTSLETEDGCHQFDVLWDDSRPDEIHLYELYADPAAFDIHLRSAHFRQFDAQTSAMIKEKTVKTFREVQQ